MACRKSALIAACLIAAIAMLKGASATVHIVGGDKGWIVPPANDSDEYYSQWSRNRTFKILDTLVFKWIERGHTVAEVTRADYECCSSNNPLDETSEVPTNITLNANETRYFICTVGSHCKKGQKVAIHVGEGNSLAALRGLLTAITSSLVIIVLISFGI